MSLQLDNVSVSYGGRDALRNVTLRISKPCLVGIIGPNGAGKSTLLRSIAGLTDHSGQISFNSKPLERPSSGKLAKTVAYCAQSGFPAWPVTVQEIVRLGRLPHRNDRDKQALDTQATQRAMETMALAGLSARRIDALSGGERSRALLARALCTQADILLVDEPTADLDPYHELKTMEVLRDEAREGVYALAVLHNLSLAARFCDVLVVLHGGKLRAQGTPQEILNQQLLNDVYGIEALIQHQADCVVVTPWRRLD